MEPYIVVEFGKETKKTKIDKENTYKPIWNEEFNFYRTKEYRVIFSLYDDNYSLDEKLG